MSISTEVSRLNSAKEAISSAITEKGVTVPDGTKLDGMAELIKEISGGDTGRIYFIANKCYGVTNFPPSASAGEKVLIESTRPISVISTIIGSVPIELKGGTENTYYFIMPSSNVTIESV